MLAPAGSFETLKAAAGAGADAVYAGGARFGARAFAGNFSEAELLEAIDYMHLHGKKLYLTVNTLLRDDEIGDLEAYLRPYYLRGLDGVIVQDIGTMAFVKEHFPDLLLHVSTQATVTSVAGAAFFQDLGAARIVPARELGLSEIRRIKRETGLEIECFVHGALCYCYSGQCLLSSMIGGRSGNRGQCAQPCRLAYQTAFTGKQDLMSLKDLDTIEILPDLMDAGIDSFKIEGRMKQPGYVYTVVSFYRKYIDLYRSGGRATYHVSREDKAALEQVYQRRGYGTGYYFRHNGREMVSLERPKGQKETAVRIPDVKLQEKIEGRFQARKDKPAALEVSGCGCKVQVEGAVVQAAETRPLCAGQMEKQLRKTGNTAFCFGGIQMQVEDGVFLPLQEVNGMRREALGKLERCVLEKYARKAQPARNAGASGQREGPWPQEGPGAPRKGTLPQTKLPAAAQRGSFVFSVLARTREQVAEAARNACVKRIYVEAPLLFSLLERPGRRLPGEKELFLASPYIFRREAEKDFEDYFPWIQKNLQGALVRNMDAFVWLKSHGFRGRIHTDSNVYAWNQWSKAVFRDSGVDVFFAPLELNRRELERLDIRGQGLAVYGHQPVMVSANCILKTTSGCTGKESFFFVKDRYGKRFPVWNACRYCYNVMFNCEPLYLADETDSIGVLSPSELRLDFLGETAGQMREILGWYREGFMEKQRDGAPAAVHPGFSYTRGHFRRGVR